MHRYFFDLVTRSYVHYDYQGRDFDQSEKARHLAELIALDVECCDTDDELTGREVQVRDISGRHLFSIPIRDPKLIAA